MVKSVLRIVGILAAIFISLMLLFFVIRGTVDKHKYSKEVYDKIELVENGLVGWAQNSSHTLKWSIEERMASYNVPGVSIAVIDNYEIEWAKGYGWADVAEKRPVTDRTLFQAASISKSLNAVGVLKLVQEGRLDLNTDINNYLTSWKFPYDSLSEGKKITLSNLLSHTAGLTIHGFPGYAQGEPLPAITEILDGTPPANTKAVHSQFAPDTKPQYSGGGTTLSQLVVEDVTRQPYEKYMQQEVLNPLKMYASSYNQPPVAPAHLLTTAYNADGSEVEGKYHIYPEQAAAGLWTSPTELAKYIIELQLSYIGKSEKVLSQNTVRTMMTPPLDEPYNAAGYLTALGVFREKAGSETYFQHSGSNAGFLCHYYGDLSGGKGVVIMTNSANSGIIREILNSVATVYNWEGFYNPEVKDVVIPENPDLYTGEYVLNSATRSSTFNIVKRDGKLFLENHLSRQIYFTSSEDFFITESRGDHKFLLDDNGNVTGFTFGNLSFDKKDE